MNTRDTLDWLLDTSSEVVTSPLAAGAMGAAVGATSSKHLRPIIQDFLAVKGLGKFARGKKLAKIIAKWKFKDPKMRALSAAIVGGTWAAGAYGGRLVHARALESRLDRGSAVTPAEQRMVTHLRGRR